MKAITLHKNTILTFYEGHIINFLISYVQMYAVFKHCQIVLSTKSLVFQRPKFLKLYLDCNNTFAFAGFTPNIVVQIYFSWLYIKPSIIHNIKIDAFFAFEQTHNGLYVNFNSRFFHQRLHIQATLFW